MSLVQQSLMSAGHQDERLSAMVVDRMLSELHVYRCTGCRLVLVEARMPIVRDHRGCGGRWEPVDNPLGRTLLLRFLTRQMFSTCGGER